ncbi:MAG: NmrA family NAD(P)-binding protein [Pseudonocardiales bacterium]
MTENTQQTETTTTLVLGGTGKTGRRVAERLTARGLPVRIGSRAGEPPFDWENRATWAPVLQGVGAAYISYFPDLAFPGAIETISTFAKLAVHHGVQRLVLLSGRGEEEARACEQEVQNSGAQWTIVRSSWFNQNFSESFFMEPVLSGELALPAGDATEPFVDADDIADVAVAALTDGRHADQVYELSGPRLLTFADIAAEISKATNRDVRYVPITAEQYMAVLQENDLPIEFVELFTKVLDGRNAYLTDGVQRALGREPRDFSDYARDTAATGVWAR